MKALTQRTAGIVGWQVASELACNAASTDHVAADPDRIEEAAR